MTSTPLPCPNPTCTHTFSPAEVAAAAALVCPRCGMRFQLRPAAAAAPPASAVETVPDAVPYAPPAEADPAPLIRGTRYGKSSKRDSVVSVFVFTVFTAMVVAALVAAVSIRNGLINQKAAGPAEVNSDAFNYALKLPGRPWQVDDTLREAVRANLVPLRKADSSAYFALGGEDFKDRNPSEKELREEAVRRLRRYFPQQLETADEGQLPADEKKRRLPATLGGRPASYLKFEGEHGPEQMTGECLMLAHQGVGYWLFSWAPSAKYAKVLPELDELRGRFKLLDKRPDWKETNSRQRTYTAADGSVTVTDPEGVWVDFPAEKLGEDGKAVGGRYAGHDEAAVLAARAADRADRRDLSRAATLVVLVIDPKGAKPLEAARKYTLDRAAEAGTEGATLEPEEKGEPLPAGVPGESGRFRLEVPGSSAASRFVVLAAVPRGDKVVVARGECDLRLRAAWEGKLGKLLAGVQAK